MTRLRIVSLEAMLLSRGKNARLDVYGVYMGHKPILFEGGQVGSQTDFFLLDAQLRPDIVPVEIDGAFRQVHALRDFLGILPLLHEIGNFEFGVRKA